MQKTISGHYGTTFSLSHNNREFLPKNVDKTRTQFNYNCVMAGHESYLALGNPLHISNFWYRYKELGDLYWSERSISRMQEYEKYQEHLQYYRRLSHSVYPIPHNPIETLITDLLLPLLVPCGIYLSYERKQVKERWEAYKQEQWIRDMAYKATRVSLRES